jgi:hypothetical protein
MLRFMVSCGMLAVLNVTCWAQVSLSLAAPAHGIPPKGAAAARQAILTYNGIQYNGGPVMNQVNGVNVYFIWYGNWAGSPLPAILTDFISHIGGTAYFNMNTSYYDFNKFGNTVKDPVVNRVNFGGSIVDNYSLGTYLTDNNVANIVGFAIGPASADKFPEDPNGVYFVLTSSDVSQASFVPLGNSCAWHSYGILSNGNSGSGVPIKVAFVGDPDLVATSCAWQSQLPTPNNSVAADGMVNMIAHELSETVTDPQINAWVNPGVIENGDLCAWTFGNTKVLPDGSIYNVTFGTPIPHTATLGQCSRRILCLGFGRVSPSSDFISRT